MKKQSAITTLPGRPGVRPLSFRETGRPKALYRISLFFWYLWYCLRYRVNPWNYFAINSRYFNPEKGIISKLEMDGLIPPPFRLKQYYYHPQRLPDRYPVFLKPEWGQNSRGVIRIPGEKSYRQFDRTPGSSRMPYIVQEAGPGKGEFEIYYLRHPEYPHQPAVLSVTEVQNACEPFHPINSIHNPCTRYRDITQSMSSGQLAAMWAHLREIGTFPMARVGVKADTVSDLVRARFKIVEINLFLPMPLVLFADNVSWPEKYRLIRKAMALAARLSGQIPGDRSGYRIFLKKLLNI